MNYHFKRIVLMTRKDTDAIVETLRAIYQHLEDLGLDVYLEATSADSLKINHMRRIQTDDLAGNVDLAIVVGGDGSLMHAARTVANAHVPVLGVNRGRLGFLTDVNPQDLEVISGVLRGEFRLEERFLLYAHVTQGEQTIGTAHALNDVVILPEDVAHMIEMNIFINDEFMCRMRSDGLVVATPTGSTAYALSGGGPILHPTLDAIVMVPMFPHSLTYRPIVVTGDSEIRVEISQRKTRSAGISCDGQERIDLACGESVKILKNRNYLKLIHPLEYDYFQTLRSKLHWGTTVTE